MFKNFRTYNLAVDFYRLTRTLRLESHLKMQLLRAASSIVLNLAEGAGRSSKLDQARFFQIAFGSIRECQAIISIAVPEDNLLVTNADKLAAYTYKLIKNCREG